MDARSTTPSAPLRWLRDIFLMAQPPLLTRRGLNLQFKFSIFTLYSSISISDFQLSPILPTAPSPTPRPSPRESFRSKQATVCHRSKTAAPKSPSHGRRLLRRSPIQRPCPTGADPSPKIHPRGPARHSTYLAPPSHHAGQPGSRRERLRTDS